MEIIMVKKRLKDGSECKKCKEVYDRLIANDELKYINRTVFADVNDSGSEGMKLAAQYNIDTAPFFIVADEGNTIVYETYLQLRKNAFHKTPDEKDEEIEEKRKPKGDDEMYYM